MLIINGTRVKLREHFPAKEFWELPSQILKLSRMQLTEGQVDPETALIVLTQVIESWEHPGDPAEISSYDNLDVLGDILPMIQAAIRLVNQRFGSVETEEEQAERLAAEAEAEAEAGEASQE